MKKKIVKAVSLLLASLMLATSVNTGALASEADAEGKVSENGEAAIGNPIIEDGITTWDCVYFGNYYQSKYVPSVSINNVQNGNIYTEEDGKTKFIALRASLDGEPLQYEYYKYEPIKWRVLEVKDGQALLLADELLGDVTLFERDYSVDYASWNNDQFRSWLNGYSGENNNAGCDYSDQDNFMSIAFTDSEKSAIKLTHLTNKSFTGSWNPTEEYADSQFELNGKLYSAGDTMTMEADFESSEDYVFLLSWYDVINEKYGFKNDAKNISREIFDLTEYELYGGMPYLAGYFEYAGVTGFDDTRVAKGTDFSFLKYNSWGIRSYNYGNGLYQSNISTDGEARLDDFYGDYVSFRPALYLDLSKSEVYKYAGKVNSNIQRYNVTYNANGEKFYDGTAQATIEYKESENIDATYYLNIDTDMCFDGWYTAAEGGIKYSGVIDADITLYAHWNEEHEMDEDSSYNIIEPTCVDKGYKSVYCKKCYKSLTEEMPATGVHTWVDNDKKPATCTEDGKEGGQHCEYCQATQGEVKTVEKLGHDFDKEGVVTKEPTLRAEGERTYKCSRCDATEKKPIDRLIEEGKKIEKTSETKNEDGTVTTIEEHTDKTVTERTEVEVKVGDSANTKVELVVDKDSSDKITSTEVKIEVTGKAEYTAELVKAVKEMVADKTDVTIKKANPDITLVTKDAAGNAYSITASAKDLKKNAKLTVYAIDPVTGELILTDTEKLKCDKKGNLEAPSLSGDRDYKLLSTKEASKALKAIKKTIALGEKTAQVEAGGSYTIKLADGYNKANIKDIDYTISSKKGSVEKATGVVNLNPSVTKGSVSVKVTVTLTDGSKVKLTQKIKIKK